LIQPNLLNNDSHIATAVADSSKSFMVTIKQDAKARHQD
jgi:hypothetical protein